MDRQTELIWELLIYLKFRETKAIKFDEVWSALDKHLLQIIQPNYNNKLY